MLLIDLIIFIIYIIIPIIFLNQLWRDASTNIIKWSLKVFLYGVYIFNTFLIGAWSMTYGAFLRYPLIFAFLIVVFKSAQNTKRSFVREPLRLKSIIAYAVSLSLSGFFTWQTVSAIYGSFCPPNAIHLDFPLKEGKFCVLQGGSSKIINHHYPVSAQRFAIDIVQLNHLGTRAKKWTTSKVEDFNIFGSIVYSPCDGVIIETASQHDDLDPLHMDPKNPGGNFIAIAMKDSDAIVYLAHFMKDSLQVKKGDIVKGGQPLAKVGNSGNTSEPHLHIHCVMNCSDDFLYSGEGMPMKFNNRFLIRNSQFHSLNP